MVYDVALRLEKLMIKSNISNTRAGFCLLIKILNKSHNNYSIFVLLPGKK